MDQHLTASYGRIVGNPISGWWAQTLVYEPPFPDQRALRGCLYAAIDVAGDTSFDAVAAGKVIVNELQESYYRTLEGGALAALEEALKGSWRKLVEHISERQVTKEVEVNIAAAVRWGTYWYVAVTGTARVALWRENQLGTIVMGTRSAGPLGTVPPIESASGAVVLNDCLLVATNAFCRLVSPLELTGLFTSTPAEAIDALAPKVYGQEGTSRIAAVLIRIEGVSAPAVDEEGIVFGNRDVPSIAQRTFPKLPVSNLLSIAWNKVRSLPKAKLHSQRQEFQPVVYLENTKPRRPLWPVVVAFGCLISLIGSLVLLKPSFSNSSLSKDGGELVSQAQDKLDEAKALADLNASRSHTLLSEAKEILGKLTPKETNEPRVKTMKASIEEILKATSRSFEREPELYYTFSLVKDGVQLSDAAFDDQLLIGLQSETKTIFSVDVAKKAAKVIAQGDKGPDQADWIVATSGKIYGISKTKGIANISSSSQEKLLDPDSNWSNLVEAEGYGGNLYLLDTGAKQIWKYIPTSTGLSTVRRYLTIPLEELGEVVDLAVDGNVWVLTRGGQILKFLNGQREEFTVKGLEQTFSSPTRLFTSESSKNLYVLDYGNQRIVVLNKDGTYSAQFKTARVAQAQTLAADEKNGRILLVTKEALYSLPIPI